MDAKNIVDFALGLGVLIYFAHERFNTWPQDTGNTYVGQTRDYIHSRRFFAFLAAYILIFVIFIRVVFSLYDIQQFFVGTNPNQFNEILANLLGRDSFTYRVMLLMALLNLKKISHIDEVIRGRLLTMARIPLEVEEFKNYIQGKRSYIPTIDVQNRFLQSLRVELNNFREKKGCLDHWQEKIHNIVQEKTQRTANWQLIRAYTLYLNIEELLHYNLTTQIANQKAKLVEIAKSLYLNNDEKSIAKAQGDLEHINEFLVVEICKTIVRKNPERNKQYNEFSTYGFSLEPHDNKLSGYRFISSCAIFVLLISTIFALLLLDTVAAHSARVDFNLINGIRWSLGSFLAFMFALSAAFLVRKIIFEGTIATAYLTSFVIAFFCSFVYFSITTNAAQNLQEFFARAIMAASFSLLAIPAVKALSEVNMEKHAIVGLSLLNAVLLGLGMGLLQVGVSLAYSFPADIESVSATATYIADNAANNSRLFSLGFLRGGLLGFVVTYQIQYALRYSQLVAQRATPRKRLLHLISAEQDGQLNPVSIKDVSKYGVKIQTSKLYPIGTDLKLLFSNDNRRETPHGQVVWSKKGWFGRNILGVHFEREYDVILGLMKA